MVRNGKWLYFHWSPVSHMMECEVSAFNECSKELVLDGLGAHLGLPKVTNQGD